LDAKLCSVSSIPCICDTNTSVNCDSSTTHPSQADLDSSRESDAASGSPIQECARASSDAKCAESSEDLVRSILEDIINASTNSNRGRRKERSKKEEDELDKTSGSLENKSSNTPSLVKQVK